MNTARRYSRRDFLRMGALTAAGAALAACGPAATPEVVKEEVIVKETVVVEGEVVEVTKVVEVEVEKVVTAVPAEVDWLLAEDISDMPHTTIRYWYGDDTDFINMGPGLVDTFQSMHPNISVLGREAPRWVDNEALLAYIKAGTHSHVHQSVYNEDLWYIDRGVIWPLEDMPGFSETKAGLNEKMGYEWEGHTYSLPWHFAGPAPHYNKTLVEEAGLDPDNPPLTYSEFLGWAQALTRDTDGDGEIDQWFMAPDVGEDWWWWEFVIEPLTIAATGTADLTQGGTAIFNTPMFVAAYQLIADLFENGYAIIPEFATDPFLGGLVAVQWPGWMGNHAYYRDNAPPGFEYFAGPVPKPDDSDAEGNQAFLFVRNLALITEIEASPEEAERMMRAAWEFERFMLAPQQMADLFTAAGAPPAAVDLTTSPLYTPIIDDIGEPFKWQVSYITENAMIGDMTNMKAVNYMDFLQQAYLQVVYGKTSAEAAVTEAEQKTNEFIAE